MTTVIDQGDSTDRESSASDASSERAHSVEEKRQQTDASADASDRLKLRLASGGSPATSDSSDVPPLPAEPDELATRAELLRAMQQALGEAERQPDAARIEQIGQRIRSGYYKHIVSSPEVISRLLQDLFGEDESPG